MTLMTLPLSGAARVKQCLEDHMEEKDFAPACRVSTVLLPATVQHQALLASFSQKLFSAPIDA